MDPITTAADGFPPVDFLGAGGAILLPSVLAAWWFWRGRRRGYRLPAFLPIAVWGLMTAGTSYRLFLALAHQGLSDSTRAGYLSIRWHFWSLAFEALAGLTILALVLAWRRSDRRPTTGRFRWLRSLFPILVVLDLLLAMGLCLFFVAPEVPREITALHTTDDGLWIGTASFFDEPALFYREKGASHLPQVFENGPRRVDVLLETDGELWAGGDRDLWHGPPGAPLDGAEWSSTDDPMVRTLAAHDGWLWAGGPNPLVRRTLRDSPQSSEPSPRVRTDDLKVGVLRDARTFRSRGDSLWIGTREGLFRWQPGDGRKVTRNLPEVRSVRSLAVFDGQLWIARFGSLLRWQPGENSEPEEIPMLDQIRALFLHSDASYPSSPRLWIGGQRGLYHLDPRSDQQVTSVPGGPSKVELFLPTADDELWLGGLEGLYRWRRESDRIERVATDLDWITALVETPEGLWIGTWREGLFLLPSDAGPATKPQRIDLGDMSHGWQRRDHLASLAVAWLGLLALAFAAVGWHRSRTVGR